MKRERISLELRVGLFVIIAILLAAVLIMTQATAGKYKGYEIGILFDYVGGLESGSPVRVSGVRAEGAGKSKNKTRHKNKQR